MDWLISKEKLKSDQISAEGGRFFYHFSADKIFKRNDLYIIIDGYIIPRLECHDDFKELHGADLLIRLMDQYGSRFINKIKGIFTLIIIEPGTFRIYTDTSGLRKFFIMSDGKNFIISNSIKIVKDYGQSAPDFINMALYCLTEHFVKDMTAFTDVRQSLPASMISYDTLLSEARYWNPEDLFSQSHENLGIEYYADWWVRFIQGYVNSLGRREATLTLTGGCDSRLVLAGMQNAGVRMKAFSYGDPASADVITAQKISEKLGIDYFNHQIATPTSGWFSETWLKTTEFGDTLINLHRVHRYHAALNEKERNKETEIIFTGLMGGEYLRGIEYDDYIISKYFRDINSGSPSDRLRKAKYILAAKAININSIDLNELSDKLQYLSADYLRQRKEREFLLAFYVYGCAHHYQDSHIYMNTFNNAVNPYMDIDFLNMIATTDFVSYRHHGSIYNTLWASQFQVRLTHLLLPGLSDIPYNKVGFYTANDLTRNRLKYISKRALALKLQKSFPPNFRYGDWMKEFVSDQLDCISPVVESLFMVKEISARLKKVTSDLSEKEWHYYTNPINLSQVFKR
jgi:hypothetical protein